MATIKLYGADWCGDTQRTRKHLDELGIDYGYINIDHNEQAKHWVRIHNDGKQKLPTLDVDGRVLSIPDNRELDRLLKEKGFVT